MRFQSNLEDNPLPVNIAGNALTTGILDSLRDLERIKAQITVIARDTISGAVEGSHAVDGDLTTAIQDVFDNTYRAFEKVDEGLLMTVRCVAKGIVLAVHDMGGDVSVAARQIVSQAIEQVTVEDAWIDGIAGRCLSGMLEAARDIGADKEDLVRAVVKSGSDMVAAIGAGPAIAVKHALIHFDENLKGAEFDKTLKPKPGQTPISRKSTSEQEQFPFY